ncbi:MAG: hypothetical protein ACREE6_14110, partial [Limisphaerales bacterium]
MRRANGSARSFTMNGKQLAGIAAGMMAIAVSVQGQQYNSYNNNYNAPEEAQTSPPNDDHHWDHWHLFHANELSLDLFGVGTLHSSDFHNGARARHDLRFGGGAGLNYFITKCIGIGGDFYSVSFHHS